MGCAWQRSFSNRNKLLQFYESWSESIKNQCSLNHQKLLNVHLDSKCIEDERKAVRHHNDHFSTGACKISAFVFKFGEGRVVSHIYPSAHILTWKTSSRLQRSVSAIKHFPFIFLFLHWTFKWIIIAIGYRGVDEMASEMRERESKWSLDEWQCWAMS